jgi:hypothetical protein
VRISRLAIVVGVATLTACGSGPSANQVEHPLPTPTLATAALGPPALVAKGSVGVSPPSVAVVTARLLTADDLPTGWTEDVVRGQLSSDTRLCNAGNPRLAETVRTAIFDGDRDAGQIAENLYGLASPADAATAYAYETARATCTTYSPPNTPDTITLGPLTFPAEGQQSKAWHLTITNTTTGQSEDKDVVLIQDGAYDVGLIERTAPDVGVDLLQATVPKALSDLGR